MALTLPQLEKKVTDLAKDLADTEKRLNQKIDNVKAGSGGTDSVVLGMQKDIANLKKSIDALIDSVDKINKKMQD